MAHDVAQYAGIELDDLTPKQLRKMLSCMMRDKLPHGKKSGKEQDEDKEKSEDENDSLVDLHREKKGDSKPPKVQKDDFPPELDPDADEEADEDKPDDESKELRQAKKSTTKPPRGVD